MMTQAEKLLPVPGYEDLYSVTPAGKVYSHITERWIGGSDVNGYLVYRFLKDGKMKHVKASRAVASTYIPNPDKLPVVNHIDGDKRNDKVDNLEWCSQKYNTQEAWRLGLAKSYRPNPPKVRKCQNCAIEFKRYDGQNRRSKRTYCTPACYVQATRRTARGAQNA